MSCKFLLVGGGIHRLSFCSCFNSLVIVQDLVSQEICKIDSGCVFSFTTGNKGVNLLDSG